MEYQEYQELLQSKANELFNEAIRANTFEADHVLRVKHGDLATYNKLYLMYVACSGYGSIAAAKDVPISNFYKWREDLTAIAGTIYQEEFLQVLRAFLRNGNKSLAEIMATLEPQTFDDFLNTQVFPRWVQAAHMVRTKTTIVVDEFNEGNANQVELQIMGYDCKQLIARAEQIIGPWIPDEAKVTTIPS